ncbi:MAG: BrnA antitoxin family protein [Acidobacteriaceae bacterium]|jgi:uncharacterized protein (DUF4415 family)|nr:BrnA antitoxin family protein [Acidobacteriaceae bacterium]
MELEWDARKAARNLKDHGVAFTDAQLVFYDRGRIERYDGREEYGEARWVIVKRTLDHSKPPRLTARQRARLDALAAMPDEQINYRDIPSRPDAVWVKAVDFPHAKQQITLRIDGDVLAFFKHTGTRYQTRINAVLRSYVEAHKAQAPTK